MNTNKQFWSRPVNTIGSYIRSNRRVKQFMVLFSFVVIGVIVLVVSHAATQLVSTQAENGSGSVSLEASSSASGGKFVRFTAVAQPPLGTPTLKVGTGVNIDKFVDGSGIVVQPRGVNRPMDFACTQAHNGSGAFISSGNFSAPNDQPPHSSTIDDPALKTDLSYADTVTQAFLSWDQSGKSGHAINTVRIPLNEECWLGINGAPAAYSGVNYQNFVKKLVDNLSKMGMYVVLDDHWSGAGNWLPGKDVYSGEYSNGQNVGPSDHALDFWNSIASKFKNYPNIMYDLFTEPSMHCTYGGTCPASIQPAQYVGDNNKYYERDDWAWTIYRDGGDYKYTYNHHEFHYVDTSGKDNNLGLSSGWVNNGSCIGWNGVTPAQYMSVACDNTRPYIDTHCALDYSTGSPKPVAGKVNCVYDIDLQDGDGDNFNSRANAGVTFHTPGLQNIVKTIRATGSKSPVAIETLGGGSGYIDMMGSHLPTDSLNQVVASTHSYDFGGKKTGTDYDNYNYDLDLAQGTQATAPFARGAQWAINGRYPFYLGEFGEAMDAGAPNNDSGWTCTVGGNTNVTTVGPNDTAVVSSTKGNFTESTMAWLDLHKYGGTAWGWDQQEGCHGPSLVMRGDGDSIKGNDTGATTAYGARVKAHLQARQGL